jgi:hypothetical protein
MAIISLSQHNAFEGKHSSVGERSMLGVFQEVAKALADRPVGGLATFDLMFEGIRTALKSAVQQSIQIAEKNLDDPFAVRVLKALFLVKYVRDSSRRFATSAFCCCRNSKLIKWASAARLRRLWAFSSATPISSATARFMNS